MKSGNFLPTQEIDSFRKCLSKLWKIEQKSASVKGNSARGPARKAARPSIGPMMSHKKYALLFIFVMSVSFTGMARAQDPSSLPGLVGRKVIVLDPGHGGHDHGAVGPSGLAEKTVALNLAMKIKETLGKDYTVHLTRNGDYWLNIENRTAMANHHRADLFLSLHTGGSSHHQARGMALYYFGLGQGLASQERGPVAETGERLLSWDHVQGIHATKSKLLANLVHGHLLARLNPMDRGIHEAPCLVLRGADMPAILMEAGYVSHPEEEKELNDPEIIAAVAEAIGQGIRAFFRNQSLHP
ncbi:MAG: N-acetylmuramoyl-L-alanine amidase [Thermodesulfobacteriota bacterium]|nr:N-acetylmuramoyl-L-alanine amidase [Thermodesulfobacteriota bacterium]